MKKIILFCLLATIVSTLNAQTLKGDWLLGASLGNISYTSSKSSTSYSNTPTVYDSKGNSTSLSIYPTIGYFIRKNHAVGAYLSISQYNSKSNSSNTSSTSTSESKYNQPSFYLGPFWRAYYGSNEKTLPFLQLGAQFGNAGGNSKSSTNTGSSSETTTNPVNDWNVGGMFGFEYFLSKNIGLMMSAGVNYSDSKTKYFYRPSTGTGYDYTSSYKRTYFNFSIGLQIHLSSKSNQKQN